MATRSKTLKELIKRVKKTKTNTGLNRGSVMFQKIREAVAPSISAASYRSTGIFLSPARKRRVISPRLRQMSITARLNKAVEGLLSHFGKYGPGTPIERRHLLMGPIYGLYKYDHITAMTATDVTDGIKKSVSKNPRALLNRFNVTASPRDKTIVPET
ncbi:MAG: hypothetical protein QXQ66_08740 [Candidatus Hadarchaeum sp.]